jgi:hypothetical protein
MREEGRVASTGSDEEDEDNLEERTVIETVRAAVSIEERRGEGKLSQQGETGERKRKVNGMKGTLVE